MVRKNQQQFGVRVMRFFGTPFNLIIRIPFIESENR